MRKALLLVLLLSLAAFVNGQSVYKTPSGAKYHLATCRMVENVSEKITIRHAIELGLTPCKICKPGTAEVSAVHSAAQLPKGEGRTTRCRGITKKGTRCQHMTSIADGYCFQHKPK